MAERLIHFYKEQICLSSSALFQSWTGRSVESKGLLIFRKRERLLQDILDLREDLALKNL